MKNFRYNNNMKQMQQEEIFAWFQSLSGAKRIELMCGLISMCIPLEVRFFDTIIQDVVKKDYNSFREAEIKANSYQELDMVCKCDLLLEKINIAADHPYYDETSTTANTEINGNGATIVMNNTGTSILNNNSRDSTPNINSNDSNNSNTTNNTNKSSSGETTTTNTNISQIITSYPSRSKLIISLCLMQPSNSPCSSIVFNAIRKQLIPENIYQAVYQVYLPKNHNIDQLFSELLLLLTMAMYHPAFTYEQRDLLASQKKEIEQIYYEIINNYIRSQHLIAAAAAAQAAQSVPIAAAVSVATVATGQTTGPAVPAHQTSTTSTTTAVITSSSGQQSNQPSIYHQTTTTNPSGSQAQTPQQSQSAQSHHPHTQPAHQYHHGYHQSSGGGNKSQSHPHHHQNAAASGSGTHLGPGPVAPTQQFSLPFIPSPMPMANIAYTTSPPMNNQTNAVIQNMALLKVNSPQQQSQQHQPQSSSPSPSSISPASSASGVANNKIPVVPVIPTSATAASSNMGQFAIKLDSMYTTTGTGGGLIPPSVPNSLITIVDANAAAAAVVPPGAICIHPPLVVDDKSSVSSTTSVSSSASCYNCGNIGHRGTECTTGTSVGDDNH